MPEQQKAYKQMLSRLRLEYEGGNVVAANEAIKAGKLLQIACGVVYGNGEDEILLPATNRIDLVEEIIEEAAAKVIVFVPFRGALEKIAEELKKRWKAQDKNWEVATIHGGVSKNARDQIFQDFQNSFSNLQVIVAQPAAMSHGLTLTAANTIIWFAPIHSNETFQQANARVSRPGQKLNQLIVMIEGTEIERRIYHRLQHRERLQGTLLQLIRGDRLEV
jgi:SNF2 family DNA or RNA helicase